MSARRVPSRIFAIDANVARAVSERPDPIPAACRDVLQAILRVCHRVVVSPMQGEEWRRHQSRFARTWMAAMAARKGKRVPVNPDPEVGIGPIVDRVASEVRREETVKDEFWLSLALATDLRILSMDERAYADFAALVTHDARIGTVHFVNPTDDTPAVLDWLERGAPDEPARCIGRRSPRGV